MFMNLLRGWLYVLLGVATLAFLAWMIERYAAPPLDSGEEMAGFIEPTTIPVDPVPEPKAETPQPLPEPETLQQITKASVTEEVKDPPTAPDPVIAEDQPQEIVLEEPTQSETPADLPVQGLCENDMWAALATAELQSEPMARIIARSPLSEVRLLEAGQVMKVFNSPFTGHSLYVWNSASGRLWLYGHLQTAPDLEKGTMLTCGSSIGEVSARGVYVALGQVPAGESWWRGAPLDPGSLTQKDD